MNTVNMHLVIVTGQAQANLIPILQLKPDVIMLAVSQEMKEKANEFTELLKRAVPNTLVKSINNVPAEGIAAIEEKALEIYKKIQHEFPQSVITYHATGGNKLMALGFYAVFAKENNSVIYTDTANGQIEFVYPRNEPAIPIKYLDMRTYLRSLGFTYRNSSSDNPEWKNHAKQRQKLSQWLAENALSLDFFLKEINDRAGNAMDRNKKYVKEDNKTQTLEVDFANQYRRALTKLNETGICQWQSSAPTKITFKSINGAKYINGFWLEEYVWLMAENIKISEVKSNVTFSRGQETPTNEMDCIAVHNNRLLAIECKTATLEKRDTRDSNNMLYKLEALGKGIGGLYHEEWLVSARPVPPEVEQRAKAAKIKIIHPDSLKDLKAKLENWRDAIR